MSGWPRYDHTLSFHGNVNGVAILQADLLCKGSR